MLMLVLRPARLTVLAVLAAALCAVGLVALVPDAAARADQVPTGAVTAMHRQGYGMLISGWAYDPDTTSPAVVHIRVDNVRKATVRANQATPSVARRRAGAPNRGFTVVVPLSAGTHEVCARVQDYPNTWVNYTIKCKTVTYNYDPMGDFTLRQAPGTLTATGWAVDFDQPHTVTSYTVLLDGRKAASGTADQDFPGLSTLHPMTDDNHGFSVTFPVAEGTHSVCLRVHNLGQGADASVRCYNPFTVNFSPTGTITTMAQAPGAVTIGGYAVDPDTTAPTSVTVQSNGRTLGTLQANGTKGAMPGHMFLGTLKFLSTVAGARSICVIAHNLGTYGKDRQIACRSQSFSWDPTAGLETAAQQGSKVAITGWAVDPDTTAPIKVWTLVDGKRISRVSASGATGSHPGHMFSAALTVAAGKHSVCVAAINTGFGTANSARSCRTVTVNLDPYGTYESVGRVKGGSDIVASGWAIDPETTNPIKVQVSVDGTVTTATANVNRPDVAATHPGAGATHGFNVRIPEASTDGEHNVCVSAVNTGGGAKPTVSLGCKVVIAVHPNPPAPPTAVTAIGGYGGAQITWAASTSDGGAPWTGYTVRTLPSGPSVTVAPGVLSATVLGLKPSTGYSFSVVANNVAGSSAAATSPKVTTQKAPPPQTTPAPISTSRYVRNLHGSSSADLASMRAEGAADARANPSGHGYLNVLDIGGQDESRHGLILTAGIRFVSYADMVKALEAYVAGYASQQRPSAPMTIAIATNNDIDVYRASGASFANNIIDPVATYARRYPGITIAGSDDMEPGFRASYASTKAWLTGYLGATTAPFVFTGSADGCSPSRPSGSCNNGWSMSGLYYLAAGAYPVRMISLPQVYNNTMAEQWRYISLTGVNSRQPRINFGGALTEWTACRQAGSCGSLTGNNAWTAMWNQLRAEPALRPSSLPYSTDLRIDS
jgi:hypothetical protein